VTESEQGARHLHARSPRWTRDVAVVLAGIVVGYAVIALLVALIAVS
jgi:hypothetical protein